MYWKRRSMGKRSRRKDCRAKVVAASAKIEQAVPRDPHKVADWGPELATQQTASSQARSMAEVYKLYDGMISGMNPIDDSATLVSSTQR
jgi:hypothetical protein